MEVASNDFDNFAVLLMSSLSNVETMLLGSQQVTESAWPVVQTTYTKWFTNDAALKAEADFPLQYKGTDYNKLYGNLSIYLYGFYIACIISVLITAYAMMGLFEKYMAQI